MLQRTLLAATLLVLTACGEGLPVSTRLVLSLRAARARWESSGIDSYELMLRRLCYCGFVELVRVKVENGVVVSRTVVSTGEPVPAAFDAYYPGVPGLFDIVEEAAVGADDLDAAFDATYGFPTEISIDGDKVAVDDEVMYQTAAFTVTP